MVYSIPGRNILLYCQGDGSPVSCKQYPIDFDEFDLAMNEEFMDRAAQVVYCNTSDFFDRDVS